ncbi:sigma-54-dependent Fis family transcriptional regulator [Candidatus Poribacteria bacterium]|nr:sigma-54-dependent Fis family transcriptional regulator [Candidatus Poribacteria bacterium]
MMSKDQIDLKGASILIVDDIPTNLNILRKALEPEGYKISVAPSGEVALKIATRASLDVILLDVVMPGMDGFETCRQLKQNESTKDIPVIFVTAARGETESIIEGFRAGGVDYISRPFEKEELLVRVETHLKINLLKKELLHKNRGLEQRTAELTLANEKLKQEIKRREQAEDALQTADEQLSMISSREAERWGIEGFVGQSKTIGKILTDIRKLHHAGTIPVLITGESGTGKELIARAIHFGGPRAKGPFIPVNCSAIPHDLAESTLFGHIRGAFTGANKDRKGYFELANGGTLFLDEIGDMPIDLQAKLLRVIEDGCVIPVGGTIEKRVDVRILAATNVDLETKIAEGTFRNDLYFRLAGFTVFVPPLRDRKEDLPLLAHHFLRIFATEMGIQMPTLSLEALAVLESYHFPGNVRELKNIIERALIESGGAEIQPDHLSFIHTSLVSSKPNGTEAYATPDKESALLDLPLNLQQAEAILIKRALAKTEGNMAEAARLLGVNRTKLYRKIAQVDFD